MIRTFRKPTTMQLPKDMFEIRLCAPEGSISADKDTITVSGTVDLNTAILAINAVLKLVANN